MRPFVYTALPARVVFGTGTLAAVADEIAGLGCSRALVLSTPGQQTEAQTLAAHLGSMSAGVFAEAAMHTPVEVTERALAALPRLKADCLVSLGGGSTIGLGKALALRTDLPQIVIPTTYAGSEATPILGETRDGLKTTQKSPRVLPEVIVYDVALTMTLPVGLSMTSGLNAIAHAAEALYAQDANPLIQLLAEDGVRAMSQALPLIKADPHDASARSQALYGAWACGSCLGAVGMALHHKLCHTLGGGFNLPHAETHAIMLAHSLAYNEAAAPEAMARIAAALRVASAPQGVFDLAAGLDIPTSLQQIGMPYDGLDRAADMATRNPYWNPRPIEREAVRALLERAWRGARP